MNTDALLCGCPLCHPEGETRLWENQALRIIRVDEPGYPGYCRVVWNAHVPSMLALSPREAAHCLWAVMATARVLERVLSPTQINIASLGNKVAHLHWHVVARFENDPHFPEAVWGPALRSPCQNRPSLSEATLQAALRAELGSEGPAPNWA